MRVSSIPLTRQAGNYGSWISKIIKKKFSKSIKMEEAIKPTKSLDHPNLKIHVENLIYRMKSIKIAQISLDKLYLQTHGYEMQSIMKV